MDHSISCEEPLNKPFCNQEDLQCQKNKGSMFLQKNYRPVLEEFWVLQLGMVLFLLGNETHYYTMKIFQVISQSTLGNSQTMH